MMFRVLSVILIVALGIGYSTACDGYKIRIKRVTNCNDKNVITIDSNFTTVVSADCKLSNSGCYTSLGFTSAKVKYTLSKNNIPMIRGDPEICNKKNAENLEAVKKLALLGFPTECPIPAGRQCVDPEKKIDISKYKKFLGMGKGIVDFEGEATHDTGVSCIKVKVEISK